MEPVAAVGGAVASATLLGVTHAVEPDHVAGITSLTAEAATPRLSALAGACFALGHVALVVAWVGGGLLLLGATGFPEVLETVGSVGLGSALAVLGGALLVRAVRDRRSAQSGGIEAALPAVERHGARTYLKVGLTGALFTLSPPVAMIAFLSGVASTVGTGVLPLAVGAYGVGIVGVMTAIGAGAGVVFRATDALGSRAFAAARLLAGALVLGMGLRFLYLALLA